MTIFSQKYYLLGPIPSGCGIIISWSLNKKEQPSALLDPHVLARVCEIWLIVGTGSKLFLLHVLHSECNVAMRLLFPLFLATNFLM
jgi:hypothetical protein